MSVKAENCGCLSPILPCFYANGLSTDEELARKQHSHEIDRQIAKDKEDFMSTHRLLLLGAGESGKSTIIKQMQLIHVDSFSENVRRQRRDDIRNNLLDAIVSILMAMHKVNARLDNGEHMAMSEWILKNSMKPNFEFSPKFYEYTEVLWRTDKGVRAAFLRNNEYQLIDSAQYFLDKINVIKLDNYLPSDQDILRCRVLTTGIYELMFQVNNVKFLMTDVGGQRNERRKWFLCFNDVTAIIFVTACSSYNMVLREDSNKNRLRESLDLFKIVWNNRWLGHISVILFLNKQDIFTEKILSNRWPLETYFPEYQQFQLPKDVAAVDGKNANVTRAQYFIKSEFEKISWEAGKCKNYENHRCYPHFTCAVDTENIKRVFDDCRDSIQRKHLIEYDLI